VESREFPPPTELAATSDLADVARIGRSQFRSQQDFISLAVAATDQDRG
jgi:hypothetical protein